MVTTTDAMKSSIATLGMVLFDIRHDRQMSEHNRDKVLSEGVSICDFFIKGPTLDVKESCTNSESEMFENYNSLLSRQDHKRTSVLLGLTAEFGRAKDSLCKILRYENLEPEEMEKLSKFFHDLYGLF